MKMINIRLDPDDERRADGYLFVASMSVRAGKIWTHDSEFTRKWRRPDGSRVPLAT